MRIIRLPIGKPSDVDTDCIRVEELDDGSYRLTGTVLCIDDEEPTSVSVVDGLNFATREEAENAGLVWAESTGVERLYVTVGTRDQPLQLKEMDLPA